MARIVTPPTYAVRFTRFARDDLSAIRRSVARASGHSDRGRSYVARIVEYCAALDVFRHRGSERADIAPGLRIVGYERRVAIAFVVDDATRTVFVLAVAYGGRDVSRLLRGRTE